MKLLLGAEESATYCLWHLLSLLRERQDRYSEEQTQSQLVIINVIVVSFIRAKVACILPDKIRSSIISASPR